MSQAANDGGFDVDAVLSGRDRSLRGRSLRALGQCAAPFYAAAVTARNTLYTRGWRSSIRLPRPVISVGNITTGGTGKTPMVIHLVRQLQAMGRHPAVLMRGYRAARTNGVSDEAQLLETALGRSVPIGVDADRVAAATRLLATYPGIDMFILDDGFQHRRVRRDLDLVLVDAANPFGYGQVLPGGLLREPLNGLRRADAVIVTRAEQLSGIHAADELGERIAEHHGRAPTAWFAHRWRAVVDATEQTAAEPPSAVGGTAGRKQRAAVFAFCGIGSPGPFLAEAMRWFDVVGTRTFADHHDYTPADVSALASAAHEVGADALLTTEKDWVKLAPLLRDHQNFVLTVPIWRPALELECMQGEAALAELLHQLPN